MLKFSNILTVSRPLKRKSVELKNQTVEQSKCFSTLIPPKKGYGRPKMVGVKEAEQVVMENYFKGSQDSLKLKRQK